MKRCILILLTALLLVFGACTKTNAPDETSTQTSAKTPAATPESTPAPSPTPTSVPDFSASDFSGKWYVAELIDSNGNTVSEDVTQNMGVDFTLELLSGGAYFVYDEDDTVLGQGAYSITLNQLTLSAAEQETAYEIQDEDTLRCTLEDNSVTVMKRAAKEPEEVDTSEAGDEDDADSEDTDDESDTLDDESTL